MSAAGEHDGEAGWDDLEQGWRLVGRDGAGRTVSLLFGDTALRAAYPGLTIGRHPALAELVIDDPSVSRRHLRICREGEALIAEDLNSLNGSGVDGTSLAPFAPVAVAAGQVLELGGVSLWLERLDHPGHPPAPPTGPGDADPGANPPDGAPNAAPDAASPVDPAAAVEPVDPDRLPEATFTVTGRWPALAGRALATLALAVLSAGLFWPWGLTRQRRRLWQETRFAGTPFRYHGEAAALLTGALAAAGIAAPVGVATVLAATILGETLPIAATVLQFAGALLGLWGLLAVAERFGRDRLANTSWRGARFRLDGSPERAAAAALAGLLATAATAGLAWPWVRIARLRHRVGRLSVGPVRFRSDARAAPLLLPWSLTLATLLLPLLAFAVINVDAVAGSMAPAPPPPAAPPPPPAVPSLAGVWLPALSLLAAVPYAWYRCEEWRQVVNHLRGVEPAGGEANARADARTATVIGLAVTATVAALVLTAALGTGLFLLFGDEPLPGAAALPDLARAYGLAAVAAVALVVAGWLRPRLLIHLAATTRFDTAAPFFAAAAAASAAAPTTAPDGRRS